MKSFKISYEPNSTGLGWQKWAHLIFGMAYIGVFLANYIGGTVDWTTYFFLGFGLCFLIFSLLAFLGIHRAYSQVILNDAGIKYGKPKKLKNIKWSQIRGINIDNHAISLHLKKEESADLNISYLQYKQLQTLKEKLHQMADAQHIPYRSKY